MIVVDGKEFNHKIFGYIDDSQILCELVNVSEEEATEIFNNPKSVIFVNSDGVKTDYSSMKFAGFMSDADAGNVRVVLK